MSLGRPFPLSLLARVSRGAFPLWARVVPGSFPFSLLVPGAFPFPFPHPQTSYPTLVGLIGVNIMINVINCFITLCSLFANVATHPRYHADMVELLALPIIARRHSAPRLL